jgi:ABC-type nitrate/sulfonate/bicarbonate transport system permease component
MPDLVPGIHVFLHVCDEDVDGRDKPGHDGADGSQLKADDMKSSANARSRLGSRSVQVGFLLVLVVLWYLATTRWRVSPLLLPNPVLVLRDLWEILKTGEFVGDLRVTLSELAFAFIISASSGIIVGYLISRSQYRIRVFEPLFAGIYAVPIILFLPLYVLFFGLGPASKIALGATISFFPIALSTIAGFGHVDKMLVTAARAMGASDYQLFRFVLLPAALPVILTGLRMGFTIALLAIIGSETIASLAGLGHRIVHLAESMEMAPMFAYIAFVVAIAAILNTLVSALEARGKRPW